jgi:hypothetical protein
MCVDIPIKEILMMMMMMITIIIIIGDANARKSTGR